MIHRIVNQGSLNLISLKGGVYNDGGKQSLLGENKQWLQSALP